MSEGAGEKKKPGLRVDRLAEAMDAARARARGEARQPPAAQGPRDAGARDRVRAAGPEEPSRPTGPERPTAPDRPPQPATPEQTPPAPDETPPPGPEETPVPSPEETPPPAPEETPPAPEETPPPGPEEAPPSAPAEVPPAPEEIPPSAPDEVPPAPEEMPPSAPDEIVPPLPNELPGMTPDGDRPQAPLEVPDSPDEIPDRPGENPPSAPDELPPQVPDELPDWPHDHSGLASGGVAAPTAWSGSPEAAERPDAPRHPSNPAPLPPLVLDAPLRVPSAPAEIRDTRHQADRISEAIRHETEARRTLANAPPQATTPQASTPPAMPPPRAKRPARAALGPPLLSLSGVATDIGRYHILSDVGFEVPTGGVTMLLGRNGAGKTTTLRTIMGLWRAKAGRIALAGEDIAVWAPPRIARSGIGYVPEEMAIFGDLTVAENMALAARSGPLRADRLDWIFATFPPLQTFWRSPAGVLSGGQKQMLAMARAMAEPRRLYLIDEPTKGLAPAIVATLVGALRDIKAQGTSILLVEQNFAVARALGDMAVVMEDGRVAWSGTMDELAADTALQERLMGLSMEGAR